MTSSWCENWKFLWNEILKFYLFRTNKVIFTISASVWLSWLRLWTQGPNFFPSMEILRAGIFYLLFTLLVITCILIKLFFIRFWLFSIPKHNYFFQFWLEKMPLLHWLKVLWCRLYNIWKTQREGSLLE